jgi:GT2 family glycosyltransferase
LPEIDTIARAPGEARPFGPHRPRVHGKFLAVGEQKLFVRGVTYGTFRSPDGSGFADAERVRSDFALMSEAGANAVRTYTVPPEWLLDAAEENGLRVLAGVPWEQHIAFLHERGRGREIERRLREQIRPLAGHPALLAFAVGNEIPASVVRWSGRKRVERHLRRLYEAAKDEDPGTLATYVNYPSTEYLELPFLDFVAFNVYLESRDRLEAYLARLQNLAGDRPLVMAELGLDSLRNGADEQAFAVSAQVRTAFEAGCAGTFVFSWTDEWHRGGSEIVDWAFGLTTRDRRAKPALAAVSRAWHEAPFARGIAWPRVSVVVCVYNGAATIADCLEGLAQLDYPDYEVIVVDDGSADDTAAIAARFPFRLIRQPNRGLSHARNAGLEAASGEIVAYIDADARPDPHWLKYLATTFADSDYAGVGGPNLAPAGDGETSACVAASPGGPIHVLLSDREAEHIPGCNMAFRRDALLAIGGFDPQFRVAGDDVDVCWRLLERGWRLGFSPAALVWHHARDRIGAYWRQQRGYGEAEALLEAKWPGKYNTAGHITWGGRVYGPPLLGPLFHPQRVYHGTWGDAAFQPLELSRPGVLTSLLATPEWYLVILLLAALALLGLSWNILLLALPALGLATLAKLAVAMSAAARARFTEPPQGAGMEIRMRALTGLLNLLQPAARLFGRMRMGLVPWRIRSGRRFQWPRSLVLDVWSERWRSAADWLTAAESTLRSRQAVVVRGSASEPWDIEVRGGHAGIVRLAACVEEHGEGRQLVRFRVLARTSAAGFLLVSLLTGLAVWATVDAAWAAAAVLGLGATGVAARAILECGVASATVQDGLRAFALRNGGTVVNERGGWGA